jgi:hypothetical protein
MYTIIVRNGTHLMLIFVLTLENLHVQVKPGLPYLDIIRLLRDNSPLPIAAYQVLLWPILVLGINKSDAYIFISSRGTGFMVASTVIVRMLFCYYVSSNFNPILSKNG